VKKEAKQADEFIEALETIATFFPDAATLRRYCGDAFEDAPMTPEGFIDFTRELLAAIKEIRKEYE
jgi:hypothetical protein